MRRRTEFGFSLIEAAVAVAIMAILATAAMPLAMKALNQQRESKTRDLVKQAYEAMYGSRAGKVPNMRSDFGFDYVWIPAIGTDLRFLTTLNVAQAYRGPGVPQAYAAGTDFSWGWNGPYWTGSTQAAAGTFGIPVDAWGRALRLYPGPVVRSAGADGVYGNADDLVYPLQAGIPGSSITITVKRSISTPSDLYIEPRLVQLANNSISPEAPPPSWNNLFTDSLPRTSSPIQVAQGLISVRLYVGLTLPLPTSTSATQVLEISPGETRVVTFELNN